MTKHYDYLILGAGPAGLQLAYYLEQQKKSYLVLEKGENVATFFAKFPRHRKLISINKVFTGFSDNEVNLRWDWNSLLTNDDGLLFKSFSEEYFANADMIVEYLSAFRKKYNLSVMFNSEVTNIAKDQDFLVTTSSGKQYSANKLIMATGVSKPYIPPIPGIEKAVNYTEMSLNADLYKNKRVLIIGKGNSGFETADHLIPYASLIHIASPNPIKMAWKSHYVGHLRAVNNNMLDTYQLKSQNAVINSYVNCIKFNKGKYQVEFAYTLASKEVETIEYDHVLVCTGFKFDSSIFDESCKPKCRIKKRFAALTSHFESVNIKDLYFCGTIMQERDFKKKQSGFIHGFRYNVKFVSEYLAYRYDNKNYKNKVLEAKESVVTKQIIKSVNRSSALWQQTGFFADVVAWDENLYKFRYFHDIPIQYIHEKDDFFGQFKEIFVVTLEFGQKRINRYPNVFAIERVHKDDYPKAALSTGIHPIVRYYKNNTLVAEHHVIEDFDSQWLEDVHVKPLEKFLGKYFKKLSAIKRKSA